MNHLLEKIKQKNASAFTHSGKFHADDVFSAALLLYLNPEITIARGNIVPENYEGLVFDIGRGQYDHHQKDSRIRDNGVPYAAFGLLWEKLGPEILGEELAQKFDESFVQPLDINDNTGEKNELATLIGNFNPGWDSKGSNDEAFFQAVSVAGMILENKFERYLGNERADRRVEEVLAEHTEALASGETPAENTNILVLPEFIPCQKRLSETLCQVPESVTLPLQYWLLPGYCTDHNSLQSGTRSVPSDLSCSDCEIKSPDPWRFSRSSP